jgi:cysteine desulfurase
MWANNETGVLFLVERIAEICHSRGVLYHCDAVQECNTVPSLYCNRADPSSAVEGLRLAVPGLSRTFCARRIFLLTNGTT